MILNEGDFVVFYPGEVHKPRVRRWRPGEGAQSGGEDADGLVDELFYPELAIVIL